MATSGPEVKCTSGTMHQVSRLQSGWREQASGIIIGLLNVTFYIEGLGAFTWVVKVSMYLSCALLCYLKCNALCSTKQDWSRLYCFRDALQCPLSTWFFPRPGLFLAAFIKFLKRGAFYVRRKVASLRASPRDWTWYTGYKLCRQRSKTGSWYNILQLWNERKEQCRSISISNLYLIGLFPTEIVQNYCFLLAFTYLGPSPKVRFECWK